MQFKATANLCSYIVNEIVAIIHYAPLVLSFLQSEGSHRTACLIHRNVSESRHRSLGLGPRRANTHAIAEKVRGAGASLVTSDSAKVIYLVR